MAANRWFQRTWLSVVLALTGVGMLVVSWAVSGTESWWSGVLLEVGVTVFLLAPLLLLTGAVERQFRGVREAQAEIEATQAKTTEKIDQLVLDIAETQEQVKRTREDLANTMRDRLSRRADAERATVDALESNPTMQATRDALLQASQLGLIHKFGICIPVGRTELLRFLPVPTPNSLGSWDTENGGFHPADRLVCRLGLYEEPGKELFWYEDQTVEDFLESLALRLRAVNRYPGDERFSQQAPLAALKDILGRALEANRAGETGTELREIVLYSPSGWVVNRYSVFNVKEPGGSYTGLHNFQAVMKTDYKDRDAAFQKHLGDLDKGMAQYLLSVLRSMFDNCVLDPDEPPF